VFEPFGMYTTKVIGPAYRRATKHALAILRHIIGGTRRANGSVRPSGVSTGV